MELRCQSCAMPIESGVYCTYCTDEHGALQSFEERLRRMSQFMRREDPSLSVDEATAKAKEYMSQMPAWRDHL